MCSSDLSTRDVDKLLAYYLPRRERTEKEIFRQMRARHRRREQPSLAHEKRRNVGLLPKM